MFTYRDNIIRISVRSFVEFLLREGHISESSGAVMDADSMLQGSRLHRKIQKAQKSLDYQAEVSLRQQWEREDYILLLEGRADGIDRWITMEDVLSVLSTEKNDEKRATEYFGSESQIADLREKEVMQLSFGWIMEESQDYESHSEWNIDEPWEKEKFPVTYVDEIKCVHRDVRTMKEPEKIHLAQAMCYAYIYGTQKNLQNIGIQMTYCNIDTEEIRRFCNIYTMEEIRSWFEPLLAQCMVWAELFLAVRNRRIVSALKLQFPYEYREGQKSMTGLIYHSLSKRDSVFIQAPTGIGKTISAMYPSIRKLGEAAIDKIFYLTARTITRTVAEDTISVLEKQQGLYMKSVTITARDKICVNDEVSCDYRSCERAEGHFDRINDALYDLLLTEDRITREKVLLYAKKWKVCPYQLCFEAAYWADFVICDYNYIYDPRTNRGSLFGEGMERSVLLVDEAHNLLDRSREMYSAEINRRDFLKMKKIFQGKNRKIVRRLTRCIQELRQLEEEYGDDSYALLPSLDSLYLPLFRLLESFQEYLTDSATIKEKEVLEFYFQVRHFYQMLEEMGKGYQIYLEKTAGHYRVELLCVDPSEKLKDFTERSSSSIFFSATLLPIEYYKGLLGGDSLPAFAIPSPFPKKHRMIAITEDVTSRYTRRGVQEYGKMLSYIRMSVRVKPGNYMVFFPSYQMMEEVSALPEYSELEEEATVIQQRSNMTEEEREVFLQKFQDGTGEKNVSPKTHKKSLVGFCVLGSIFSEGIDLTGDCLIGVIVVGTGLPQVGNEREIIRSYFDRRSSDRGKRRTGYDYAYSYPGMNKVLQAAGRVIRTMEDRGTILLMDDRFLRRNSQEMLPQEWDSYYRVNLHNYEAALKEFWGKDD